MVDIIEVKKFPEAIKGYFENSVQNCKVKLKYMDAKLICFHRCNIKYITAFRIIAYSKNNVIEILYVGKDDDNYKKFYLNSLAHPITIGDIVKVIKDMT